MLGFLKCLIYGHRFQFTKEYIDKFHPADDKAISCRCLRCGRDVGMDAGYARQIAPQNPKLFLKTGQELGDYCSMYLTPVKYIRGRPVFRQSDVDKLHIEYPEQFKTMFED